MKNIPPYVTEDKSSVSEGEERHVQNEDEIVNLTNHSYNFNVKFIY